MSAADEFDQSKSKQKIFGHVRRLGWHRIGFSKPFIKTKLFAWTSASPFDIDEESLFWQERHTETLKTLKSSLLLVCMGFLAFLILDVITKRLLAVEIFSRIMVVAALIGLFAWLNRKETSESATKVTTVANLGATLSASNLVGILLINANPSFYAEVWPGLLPIYFVTYGQLVMPLSATLVFGWLTLIALPTAGYFIGVEASALMVSCLMLFIVNIFGMLTRYQMEAYSRKSFHSRRTAEAAAEEKALFMRQTSHNLRQPLQALSCYSSVLDNALLRSQIDEVRHTANKLGVAIDELNESFNHILDIANLETGKQMPYIQEIDINLLLTALEVQFAPQAAKKGLRLKVRLRTRPPFIVWSDANMLRQILGNLIDNAIKYTLNGWVLVGTSEVSPNQLKVHVRDTGIGIPEGQSESIFHEFHRSHRRQNDPHPHGLGIGLAYAMKASERLPRHSLSFHPKRSRGTDFQFNVPVVVDATGNSPTMNPVHGDLIGCYVFVVDDDEDVLNALAGQIECWGCLVDKARSLDALRQLLEDNLRPPDILVTDFYLGQHETAHDVINAVEADCGPVPTLVLSARAIPEADKAKWPNSTLLLRKPASAASMLKAMIKLTGKNQASSL